MHLTTTLLNGQDITLATSTSAVERFGTPVRSSVLLADGIEIEVHAGDTQAADFFFSSTGSQAGSPLRLRGGLDVLTGAYGGRAGQGLAFRLDLAGESLFGMTPPTVTREALTTALAAAGIARGRSGMRLRPSGAVAWSPHRAHGVAVTADAGSSGAVLLDVRRTMREPSAGGRGRQVRGGWLSRSDPSERVHVVLEADDAVCYGLPPTEDDLDLAVQVLADLQIDVVEEAP